MRARPFPDASFEQPPVLPPQPHRDATSTNKEVVTSEFSIQAPDATNTFSPEVTVLQLDQSWTAADVYLNIKSVQDRFSLPPGFFFEIAATLYAISGNTRTIVNRGAYRFRNDLPGAVTLLPFLRDFYIGAARMGAEKFEVTLRFMGHDDTVGGSIGVIKGTVTAIGYLDPPGLITKPVRVYSKPDSDSASPGKEFFFRGIDVYRLTVSNEDAADEYLQIYDQSDAVAPAAGSKPFMSILIPAHTTLEFDFEDSPLRMTNGFFWVVSSTGMTYTAVAGHFLVQLQYA